MARPKRQASASSESASKKPRQDESGFPPADFASGLPTKIEDLPAPYKRDLNLPHAPKRTPVLTTEEKKLAVRNALRYFDESLHATLAHEFSEELKEYGHIYMYRFKPTTYAMKAYPIDLYPTKCNQAAAALHMIMNNLDPAVAQFPEELVTYGGNGQVFSNWAQYRLVVKYLCEMTTDQTLSMYSGHPMGLFPSSPAAPRIVITNGMVIPNYSSRELYEKYFALGVSMYGQMTAGSYCYIGPQGIVHGTAITVLNAGRKYLGSSDLAGKVFVTSGLGGMSGAQAKAAVIVGCICVIAEVNEEPLLKRHKQGWLTEYTADLEDIIARIRKYQEEKKGVSIGYLGNVVDLWERFAKEDGLQIELGSDQTSCHNVYGGGYYPVGVPFAEAQAILENEPARFKDLVQESLRRHVAAINVLTARGMKFWDYGNAFMLEASRANAEIMAADGLAFKYPSYVQDIMGDIFSLGFGPFRWVCTSGLDSDLEATDKIAKEVIEKAMKEKGVPDVIKQQYEDNHKWIVEAGSHKLAVGSRARILYSDQEGRANIAVAMNKAVKSGRLHGPVVISRDHHDVSGTDSPFRETSNITDGSSFTADMAIQNVIGDSFRGATWVAIHNGGGVGWGEVMNGGFGLVLDGSAQAEANARKMLAWDVSNGVARRSWGGNANACLAIGRAMDRDPALLVTQFHDTDKAILDALHV